MATKLIYGRVISYEPRLNSDTRLDGRSDRCWNVIDKGLQHLESTHVPYLVLFDTELPLRGAHFFDPR